MATRCSNECSATRSLADGHLECSGTNWLAIHLLKTLVSENGLPSFLVEQPGLPAAAAASQDRPSVPLACAPISYVDDDRNEVEIVDLSLWTGRGLANVKKNRFQRKSTMQMDGCKINWDVVTACSRRLHHPRWQNQTGSFTKDYCCIALHSGG